MSKPQTDYIDIALPPGKKLYFASDFHLGAPDYASTREREERIVKWLDEAEKDMAALFLLGDVFDYWFEYIYVMPKGNIRLLGKLAELTDKGIPVYFFWGNHDAWTLDFFEKELGMKICKGLAEICVNGGTAATGGATLLAGHGDGLGPGQRSYKRMKKVFLARWARFLFSTMHPYWAHRTATGFSRHNRRSAVDNTDKNEKNLQERYGYLKCFMKDYCRECGPERYPSGFVFAHSHQPALETLENGAVYANTGDWLRHNTYVTFDGSRLELLRYKVQGTGYKVQGTRYGLTHYFKPFGLTGRSAAGTG